MALPPRLAWILDHSHLTHRGARISLQNRAYLRDLYADMAPRKAIRKSVQCGVSELLIVTILEAAGRGLSSLYVLPSDDLARSFVQNRIDPLFYMVDSYRELLKAAPGPVNNIRIKRFAKGSLKFVGANTPNAFIEYPADLLVLDELDRCIHTDYIEMAVDRLSASAHKEMVQASRPEQEACGISAAFDLSDQRQWHLRCEACGDWQPLDFFVNVLRQVDDRRWDLRDSKALAESRDVHVLCRHCERPLDRLGEGQWIAAYPNRETHGYQINKLFSPTNQVLELVSAWKTAQHSSARLARFFNSDLGLPYTPSGMRLRALDLDRCTSEKRLPDRAEASTMGVDVGSWFHVRISLCPEDRRRGPRVAAYIGRVGDIRELDELLERYGVRVCVVDARPETRLILEWQRRHPRNRIWRCDYAPGGTLRELVRDRAQGIVRVDRTQALDAVVDDIRERRLILPANAASVDNGDYYAQLLASVRVLDEESNQYRWVLSGEADHYFHAEAYDRLALALWPFEMEAV